MDTQKTTFSSKGSEALSELRDLVMSVSLGIANPTDLDCWIKKHLGQIGIMYQSTGVEYGMVSAKGPEQVEHWKKHQKTHLAMKLGGEGLSRENIFQEEEVHDPYGPQLPDGTRQKGLAIRAELLFLK